MRITISGTPGSGKSTAATLLAAELGYPRYYVGQLFRAAARERGMTLEAFGAYVGEHPEIDDAFDRRLLEAAQGHEDIILEGRVAGWMTRREHLPAFRVWITAAESVRIDRLMGRDGGTREETTALLRKRTRDEQERYRTHYGLDLADCSIYDLIVETDAISAAAVASRIREALPSHPHSSS